MAHNRETLLALADRAEKATGHDEALDFAIWEAFGRPAEYLIRDLKLDVFEYSSSLDAAMTLVPEGFAATVTRFADGRGKAIIWQVSWVDTHKATDGTLAATPALALVAAATPALALCAAALRARATLDPTGEKA